MPGGQVVVRPENMTTEGAQEVWLPFTFVATALTMTPAALNVPPPCDGTFIGLKTSSTGQPGGSITFTPSIGGANVPGGAVTLTSSDSAGTVRASAPTSGNAVSVAGPPLRIAGSVASPGNQNVVLLVGFRRS